MNWAGIAAVGLAVGFLAGLFGKGGSAIATPLLHAFGVPAIVAVAAPLPAAIPSTLVASAAYRKARLLDRETVAWSIAVGVPTTVVGAVATRWISGGLLVSVTDVVVAGLGLRFLFSRGDPAEVVTRPTAYRARLVAVSAITGLASGLLANSGGFLLAPLYVAVLRRPLKTSFACSLAVAAALAVPGTIVHALLGHIDWAVVLVFGACSVPLSYLGARVALRADAARLERIYGAALTALGIGFLLAGR
ncbi:MAG: sulfite exporter TauE/SafE family protein [Actinomycetota bacterium]|nr:sulfite exporter TauE/SafE family protein [Actinomycetota bacterium]